MIVSLMEIDKSLRDRLYVVQVACESGWKLARTLSAVNQGKFFANKLIVGSCLTD